MLQPDIDLEAGSALDSTTPLLKSLRKAKGKAAATLTLTKKGKALGNRNKLLIH